MGSRKSRKYPGVVMFRCSEQTEKGVSVLSSRMNMSEALRKLLNEFMKNELTEEEKKQIEI